mmetsp:Transcript_26727/g.75057  ORF Transcript_26727/g.75057 Transcript_26727/m.75057 type:complete len:128 (+) Transcript_26727:485-868(+)
MGPEVLRFPGLKLPELPPRGCDGQGGPSGACDRRPPRPRRLEPRRATAEDESGEPAREACPAGERGYGEPAGEDGSGVVPAPPLALHGNRNQSDTAEGAEGARADDLHAHAEDGARGIRGERAEDEA